MLTSGLGPQASLVYDPAVDLWTPVTLSSSDPGPDPDWRPCRAAVHKDAVYFLGKRLDNHNCGFCSITWR